jgi:hypothetical protein
MLPHCSFAVSWTLLCCLAGGFFSVFRGLFHVSSALGRCLRILTPAGHYYLRPSTGFLARQNVVPALSASYFVHFCPGIIAAADAFNYVAAQRPYVLFKRLRDVVTRGYPRRGVEEGGCKAHALWFVACNL